MARKKKTDEEIKALLAHEIRAAITYDDSELSDKRARALEYYFGNMRDTPPTPNRSSVVSRDVSDVIDWMLPGIVRIYSAGNRIVDFEPQGQEDEEGADQASDYINYLWWRKNDGYRVMRNAVLDALIHGDGVIKHWWDDYEDAEEQEVYGIDEMQLVDLLNDPDIEILEQSEAEGVVDQMGQPVALYDLKIRKIKSRGKICIECVPPEDFLMDKDTVTLERARFVAHRCEKTRSELLEMGFDKEKVRELPRDRESNWREETLAREGDRWDVDDSVDASTDLIELFECYATMDVNGDGISETIRAYYAGNGGAGELLDWDEWEDDVPFTLIPCSPVPHRADSQSIAEKLMDVQRIKTVMLRQLMDNTYAHNNPQPIVVEGSVVNPDALVNPKFGQPVIVRKGMEAPVNWRDMPFVGDSILAVLGQIDAVIERRTGISRATMALDPEALQNQTATAVQKQQDSAYSKIELVARDMAELGFKHVFRKMLRLVVKHQDREQIIRLRNKWVPMDPRQWNADMDCTVNVGLGSGSRDRDMAMLNQVLMAQYQLTAAAVQNGAADIAIEMLPKIVDVLVKQAEAAGIRNGDQYYPDFSPERLQGLLQAASQPQEDPKIAVEREKAQIDAQAKQAAMQMDMQKLQMEQQARAEQAQNEAALAQMKMESEIVLKREQMGAEIDLKREQLAAELALRREQLAAELQIKRELGMHAADVNASAKVATSTVRMGGEAG